MREARVTVNTGVGLHARPAAVLVQAAKKFACSVMIEYEGQTVDARSILQVLSLGVKDGRQITLRTDGEGEAEALAALVALFENGLVLDG